MSAWPRKFLSTLVLTVRLAVSTGTLVPLKRLRPLTSRVFLKSTLYLRLRPEGLTFVSPSMVILTVSLLVNQTLKVVKASMSSMVMSWLMLTCWCLAAVVAGNSREAKGVCGSRSSRYMRPVNPSTSAWMEPSVVMVELTSMR